MHYQRLRKHGDVNTVIVREYPTRYCTEPGCENERGTSATLCEKHRGRMRRHGDTDTVLVDYRPAEERWRDSYEVDPETGCWNWTGPTYKSGHGFISEKDVHRQAHRFVWERVVGPIPEGIVLDHHNPDFGCKNKRCVNPEHLDPVTQSVNSHRGDGSGAKTHCPAGHEYDDVNTYITPGDGSRKCRACARRSMRENKHRYGYVYVYAPGHPLASKGKIPKVAEHRQVLYDAIGPGPHPCHWGCGRIDLQWGGIGGIHADHLNDDASDNRRENLVVSCQRCNNARAAAKRKKQ